MRIRARRLTVLLSILVPGLLLWAVPVLGSRNEPPDRVDYRLQLDVTDGSGNPLAARARVYCSDGRVRPDSLDHERLAYTGAGGYFYPDGSAWLTVPSGWTRITIGKGFEWTSFDRSIRVHSDTTLQVVLNRFVDLGAEGWYSGDLHSHTQHPPIDYDITPPLALRITKAEGLNIANFLDQDYNFTGAPDPLSDAETILYYALEYRNGTYGHFDVPGLRVPYTDPWGCCNWPSAPYPMILDLRRNIVPEMAPMIVIGHPHTTDSYFEQEGWPANGYARELPVLAALGALDALDVVSYSNSRQYQDWQDYYDLLSAGLPCSPSAGTDAGICGYITSPLGGWRVYANLGPGAPLDYYAWLDALKAGRTFITSYPLIPDFQVGTAGPGDVIENPDSTLSATVRIRALCQLRLSRISLVADGATVWTADLTQHLPLPTSVDTTFEITIPTPGWIVARVQGMLSNPHAAISPSLAVTSAIRVTQNGQPIRRTLASARWLDNLDSLTTYVLQRGHWQYGWQTDTVMARIERARSYYRRAFVIPPSDFHLLYPALGESIRTTSVDFIWDASSDPEAGDRIMYDIFVARDSLFHFPVHYRTALTWFPDFDVRPGRYYWYVVATDRGLNATRSTPPLSWFDVIENTDAVENETDPDAHSRRCIPNPSSGPVRLKGLCQPVLIIDTCGRVVARTGDGISRTTSGLMWDGRIHGHPAPAGLYWARDAGSSPALRLIRIR